MADEKEVSDAQAVAWLKQMQFEWRTLIHAQKVMETIIEGRKFLAGLEAQKTAVENDIKAGQARLDALGVEQTKQRSLAVRAKDETDTIKAKLNAEIKEIETERDRAKLEFEQLKQKIERDRGDLIAQTEKKATEFTALQKAFDSFKREHRI